MAGVVILGPVKWRIGESAIWRVQPAGPVNWRNTCWVPRRRLGASTAKR